MWIFRAQNQELDTEIEVGRHIDKIEYDYDTFRLSMDCYWCEIKHGNLSLLEHEAAKWLTADDIYSVEWLPADKIIIPEIRDAMREWE